MEDVAGWVADTCEDQKDEHFEKNVFSPSREREKKSVENYVPLFSGRFLLQMDAIASQEFARNLWPFESFNSGHFFEDTLFDLDVWCDTWIYIYMCVFRIPFFLSYTCTCTPPQKRQHTFCQRVLRNIWNRFSKKEPSWFAHWTPRLHTWQEKLDAQYLGAKPFKLGMQSWKFWQHNWHPHDIWKS